MARKVYHVSKREKDGKWQLFEPEAAAVADTVPGVVRCACLYNGEKKRIELFCQAPGLEGKAILSALRGRLTDYMLPSRVHVLDRLPLNQNGKLDRPALAKLL